MNEPQDPNRTVDVPSGPADSLDAGLAAGFGRPAEGPSSVLAGLRESLGDLRPPLLKEAQGESAHVVRPKSDAMPPPEQTGDRYQLPGEIARGGMGVIYRATDTALGREVAVKVLQERYAPESGAARRFADEAHIAAQLQHPGIPPVHDLGTLPDGRPFLAMKLIKGQTLEDLLAARPEASAERGRFVAVFEAVCQAIAYAHAHQIIHRDLKPANVMVGAFGEVQVMDWGLAKVLTARPADAADPGGTTAGTQVVSLRDSGPFTQAGSVLGTPALMPPEQAVGAVGKVDRRSDVFGLGGILAVILTGQPPFAAASAETIRVMAAQGDVAECLARLGACGAGPGLVALCQRCLSPRPADRPADAGEVARAVADLRAAAEERARAAERERAAAEARAVEQRRKRRWQLAAAGAVVLALVAGLGGLGLFLRAQAQANAELRAANQREHERFELALDAIKTFHTGVSEDVLPKEEQFKGLRERLLRQATAFYGKLQALLEGQPDADSQRALAQAYFLLAELTFKIGANEEALALHRKALALRRGLAARGEAGAELAVARSLLAISDVLDDRRDAAGMQAAAEEALALAEAASPSDEALTVNADSHEQLGRAARTQKEWEEAIRHSEKVVALRKQLVAAHPGDALRQKQLAAAHVNHGIHLSITSRPAEALPEYQEASTLYEDLARADPGNAELHDQLAKIHNNLGNDLGKTNKRKEAVEEFTRAVQCAMRAIEAQPAVKVYRNDQAFFYNGRGEELERLGQYQEALEAYRKGEERLRPLVDAEPTNVLFRKNLAIGFAGAAKALTGLGKAEDALREYDQAERLYRELDAVRNEQWKAKLATALRGRGMALQKLGRPGEAVKAYRESITLLESLAKPTEADRHDVACGYALLHGLAQEKGSGLSNAEAHAAGEQAVATLRRAIAAGYRNAAWMRKESDLSIRCASGPTSRRCWPTWSRGSKRTRSDHRPGQCRGHRSRLGPRVRLVGPWLPSPCCVSPYRVLPEERPKSDPRCARSRDGSIRPGLVAAYESGAPLKNRGPTRGNIRASVPTRPLHRHSANLLRPHRPRHPPAPPMPRYLTPVAGSSWTSRAGSGRW
jgi:tetratricopeptide (TPR) repeat protein